LSWLAASQTTRFSQRDYHDLGGTIIICLVMKKDLLQHPLLKLALDRKELPVFLG
jgi:hypothetical protein